MAYPKRKRVVDKKLLKEVRELGCLICGRVEEVHHRKTRGAGGGDVLENLMPLCRSHHVEIGQIGETKFLIKYNIPKDKLEDIIKRKLEVKRWTIKISQA